MTMKLEEKVDAMRRKLLIPIYIRGVSKAESFSDGQNLNTTRLEIPAYFADPLFSVDSKEWISRLQATLHAASCRAIMKCYTGNHIKWKEGCSGGDFEEGYTPEIMAFGEEEYREGLKFMQASEHDGVVVFDHPFKQRREMYESAAVHGNKRMTFPENSLPLHGLENCAGVQVDVPKLFDVSLSPKEMKDIVFRINSELRLRGYNNLNELAKIRHPCDWATALDITKNVKCLYSNSETEVDHPEVFLVHSRVAQALTTNFTRKLAGYIEKLPEINITLPVSEAS